MGNFQESIPLCLSSSEPTKKKTNQPTLNTDVDVDDVEKVPFSVGYAARFNSGQLISFMLSFHL